MKKAVFNLMVLTLSLLLSMQYMDYNKYVMRSSIIDDTNHGWEVKRNNMHKQPDIPINAKEAIKKYNGVYTGSSDSKVIYLTIDLGYESGNTQEILNILKQNDIKATFFIVSSYLNKNSDIVDRIVGDGHSLQNHTANYKHLNKLSEYQVKREISDLHDMIFKRYGISTKYLRLPYEDWSDKVLKIACESGYKTVFWSVACVDWVEGKDASYIYNSIMDNYHNGAVILTHAVSRSSPQAIEMITRDLKKKGFEFRTLDM